MTFPKSPALGEMRYAILEQDTALVAYLIEQGLDPNRKQHYFEFPLIIAIRAKSLEMVALLIEKGADVNIADHNGYTPLMEAAHEDLSILGFLIEKGALLEAKDLDNDTALEWARDGKLKGAVELLQEAAAMQARQKRIIASHDAATASQSRFGIRNTHVKARPACQP